MPESLRRAAAGCGDEFFLGDHAVLVGVGGGDHAGAEVHVFLQRHATALVRIRELEAAGEAVDHVLAVGGDAIGELAQRELAVQAPVAPAETITLAEIPLAPIVIAPLAEEERP